MQRMIDLQDDCPHPAGTVVVLVVVVVGGSTPVNTRGDGVTSWGC